MRRLAPRSVPTPAAVEQALAAASVDDEVPDDELEEEEERDINGDDVKSAYRKLFPYRVELTDEEKAEKNKIWFDTPSEPPIEGRKERQLQWFLGKLERRTICRSESAML